MGIVSKILDLLYPKRCVFCDEILENENNSFFCDECISRAKFISSNRCSKCGKALKKDLKLCDDCKYTLHFYNEGRSLLSYSEEVKDVVIGLKQREKLGLAYSIGSLMADFYKSEIRWEIDVVTAVPMHYKDFEKRGFNQSELIGKEFSKKTELTFNKDILTKVKSTENQKSLDRNHRLKNLVDAFIAEKIDGVHNVLLIDDVYTTGATIDACSKALIDAGYKNIYFLTFASASSDNKK